MHELSLCEGIRQLIEDHALTHGFARVALVRLEVGRFAGVETAALAFAFDVAMQGSLAEGARLEVISLPGRAACFECGESVVLEDRLDPCPQCGGGRLLPVEGEEVRLKELEVS